MSEQVKGIPERAPEPPYMDFPEAWAFVRTTKLEDHHMRCSWRSGVLCDCNVLWAEYYKRKAARSEQALAALEDDWWVRLGKFRMALHAANLHGHYNLLQEHFEGEAGKWEELQQQVAALEARNKKLEAALLKALVAFDAFWPSDPPENETQIDEDRAVAEVRKLARAALKGAS